MTKAGQTTICEDFAISDDVIRHLFCEIMLFQFSSTLTRAQVEDGSKRGDALRCELVTADIDQALKLQPVDRGVGDPKGHKDATNQAAVGMATRVWENANLAMELAALTHKHRPYKVDLAANITRQSCRRPSVETSAGDENPVQQDVQRVSSMHMITFDWRKRYDAWRANLYSCTAPKTPNAEQTLVLELIHHRRLVEHAVENNADPPEHSTCSEPLLRLVHGLPGSGKTEVLRWIRSYFEEVWSWTLGTEFVFLAPLNSMASNISGATVHSWGHVAFKNRRGEMLNKGPGSEEVPSMTMQCNTARFIFIDEVEAIGAETLGELENTILSHTSLKSPWRRKRDGSSLRCFGGINLCFFGDFWQLPPTGQIALMSDVTGQKVLQNARASYIMNLFWNSAHGDSLQTWSGSARVMELTVNIRSGEDVWYSKLLDACRSGTLQEDDYNFLHGYPTAAPITFWYHRKGENWVHAEWCQNAGNKKPFFLDEPGIEERVLEEKLECQDCFKERKRRARAMHLAQRPAEAAEQVNAPEFAASVYITAFNKSVFLYAAKRARRRVI